MGLSAFYDLAASEDRGLVEWLIGDRLRDVRYDLFEFLSSPPIKDRFGLVIIDAPPRTTLASIQALCASTHVLIPTKLDDPSANAVGYFATHLNTHRHIWPKLRVAGIIGCMTRVSPAIEPRYLTTSGDALRNILSGADLRHVESLGYDFEIPYEMGIRNLSPIVRAAERGAAVDVLTDSDGGADVRTMFDNLAQELEARMR
jgi:chromosome partitioning protein